MAIKKEMVLLALPRRAEVTVNLQESQLRDGRQSCGIDSVVVFLVPELGPESSLVFREELIYAMLHIL